MQIINNNPFRIVGILANTTTRELERQKGRIKAYARVGREIKSDFDVVENGSQILFVRSKIRRVPIHEERPSQGL